MINKETKARRKNILDSAASFVQDAMDSAFNYYQHANKGKFSRVTVRLNKMKQLAPDLWQLSLDKTLRQPDSIRLCINSPSVDPAFYDDMENRFIKPSLYKIVAYDIEKNTLTIELKPDLNLIFPEINIRDVTFVSDLKFLIENVGKWYGDYGHHIRFPSPPILNEENFFYQGLESDDQKQAMNTALTSPISYIWGAPGTGKTQVVLANCIISYILQGKQVLIVAPTNNAIEQILRSVIPVLQKQKQDVSVLYRMGSSTNEFVNQYGNVCERMDRQKRIEEMKQQLDALKQQQAHADKYHLVLTCYEKLREMIVAYEEKSAYKESLMPLRAERQEQISKAMSEIRLLYNTLHLHRQKEHDIAAREESFAFKLKKRFTKKEAEQLDIEKTIIADQIVETQRTIVGRKNMHALLEEEEKELDEKIQAADAELQSILNATKTLPLSVDASIDKMKEAESEYACYISSHENVQIVPDLPQRIQEKERQFQQLSENLSKEMEKKLVFACTIDYFFAHYKNLSDVGLKSSAIAHVFLDEAAYCPFIKSGILFSLGVPVTFLGDHMQLPPICEAGTFVLNSFENKVFLWAIPAFYFSKIFLDDFELEQLFEEYQNHVIFLPENTPIAPLPHTFRFGHNLASILNRFVYQNGFSGQKDFQTSIVAIHAPKEIKSTAWRSNEGEAEAIRRYILENDPQNYVVITPYNAQKDILIRTLHNITDPDNISTIHASQGREWDTVIISVADTHNKFMSNSSIPQGLYTMNTAISRAKKQIVIVCDFNYWKPYADTQLIGSLIREANLQTLSHTALPLPVSNQLPEADLISPLSPPANTQLIAEQKKKTRPKSSLQIFVFLLTNKQKRYIIKTEGHR